MIKLYRHQKLALNYMRLYPSFALFMEQGVGKTLPCLFRILDLLKNGDIENALIIAPKATMGAWYRDIDLFDESDRSLLLATVTVVNYEMVWRKTDLDIVWKRSKKYDRSIKGDYDRRWDCLILDESHCIKNRTSLQAQMALHLSLTAQYRYILTGTPIGNGSLENLWSQYAFLSPYEGYRRAIYSNIFGGSYYEFLDEYAYLNQWHKPYKYKNVDKFQSIMKTHSYRVLKAECLDLPDKLPDEIYDIDLLEPKIYKELHKESTIEDLDLLAENPLARLTKLRQVASGFVINDEKLNVLNCEKIKVLENLLEDWNKKLVIFAEYKQSIKSITTLLKTKKIKYVVLDGEQQDKQIWRQFQNDESIQIIVVQYLSGCAGIDLYAADTILYYEPTLSSTVLEQSRDRIHRIGQKNHCSYIHFLTKGTVEKAIYRALKGYTDFNAELFTEYITDYQKGFNQGGTKK